MEQYTLNGSRRSREPAHARVSGLSRSAANLTCSAAIPHGKKTLYSEHKMPENHWCSATASSVFMAKSQNPLMSTDSRAARGKVSVSGITKFV